MDSDCNRCPHSFLCLTGRPELMATVKRMFCDPCRTQFIRVPVVGGWHSLRCSNNHISLPDPEPWVCSECMVAIMAKRGINDEERRVWILNDEGLYLMQRGSGKSMKMFIREHRKEIDEVILNVRDGKLAAHYLKYGE